MYLRVIDDASLLKLMLKKIRSFHSRLWNRNLCLMSMIRTRVNNLLMYSIPKISRAQAATEVLVQAVLDTISAPVSKKPDATAVAPPPTAAETQSAYAAQLVLSLSWLHMGLSSTVALNQHR
ncbi:hypothetical protein JB92DRAFT_2112332 [Gautieria morchelliformis]|nr:hypothetical protein JB92DRAFT_2112332 [Gautieria morchelliformis]